MARHILFLVHGMGRYGTTTDGKYKPDPTTWFEGCEKELKATYDKFAKAGPGNGKAFDNLFVIKRIEYDSVLDGFRDGWEKQAEDWNTLGVGNGFIGAIQKFFQGNSDDAFLWTHLADAALYMAPTVRAHVQTHVAAEITKVIATAMKAHDFSQWSVIAHSLGTAVTHDTVSQLYDLGKSEWAENLGPLPAPRALVMLGNVARLLTNDATVLYADTVAPKGPGHPFYYVSCAHALDPFTRLSPFLPLTGAWASPRYKALSNLDTYYLAPEVLDWALDHENLSKFAEVVPHSFKHYLRQPEVVSTLWPMLLAKDPASYPGVAEAARQAYQAAARDDIKTTLKPKLDDLLGGLHVGDPVLERLLKLLKKLPELV